MGDLGDRLRNARIEKNLTLLDVEEATKIRNKYLQALEEENFDVIPGRTYIKGFLRIYSKFLDIDPEEIISEFELIYSPDIQEDEHLHFQTPENDPPGRFKGRNLLKFIAGAAVGILLVLFMLGYVYKNYHLDGTPPKQDTPGIVEEQDKDIPEKHLPPIADESNQNIEGNDETGHGQEDEFFTGVNIDIEIMEDECWVKVISDTEQDFQGILKAGDKRSFNGQEKIIVTLGNAGVAKLFHNGREIPPLGSKGAVVTESFDKSD